MQMTSLQTAAVVDDGCCKKTKIHSVCALYMRTHRCLTSVMFETIIVATCKTSNYYFLLPDNVFN